jgi:hypothetical protein
MMAQNNKRPFDMAVSDYFKGIICYQINEAGDMPAFFFLAVQSPITMSL